MEFDHPTVGLTRMAGSPISYSKTPPKLIGSVAQFGQNTEEVLQELGGYSWEEIGKLREEGVV